jgi:hypothetical protein
VHDHVCAKIWGR